MDIVRWISLGIIVLIMIISIIVEITIPTSFGMTTFFSFIPSAIIAGSLPFQWYLPIIEIASAIVCWLLIYYCVVYQFFVKKQKNKKETFDYDKSLMFKPIQLLETTSNINGNNKMGIIKIDDKTYNVLPNQKDTTILSNEIVKIVEIKGNICFIEREK